MHKVLVTGGNGFIGQYTVRELVKRGYSPVVLDNHESGYVLGAPEYDTYLGDIRDAESMTEVIAHVDGCIHLAGVLGTQETIFNPRPAALTNIQGGLNLLEAVTQYDVPMVNIAVGNYWMNNTYSISKSTVERFCEMFRVERGARVSVLRALNAYGPGQSVAAPYGTSKVRKIMPAFICRALTNTPIEIYGDGEQVMDMVYVGDVARDLVDLLEATEQHGPATTTLESGTGRDTTVRQIAEEVLCCAHLTDPFTYGGVTESSLKFLPMRPGEPKSSVVKANRPYGREYKSLEDGVLETVRWFNQQRGTAWHE